MGSRVTERVGRGLADHVTSVTPVSLSPCTAFAKIGACHGWTRDSPHQQLDLDDVGVGGLCYHHPPPLSSSHHHRSPHTDADRHGSCCVNYLCCCTTTYQTGVTHLSLPSSVSVMTSRSSFQRFSPSARRTNPSSRTSTRSSYEPLPTTSPRHSQHILAYRFDGGPLLSLTHRRSSISGSAALP